MKVEILYFQGCPSWINGLANLAEALSREKQNVKVDPVLVKDNQQAELLKFLGSPSFRVDGMDLWPSKRSNYALSCRLYSTPRGIKGVPTIEMIQEKIRVHLEANKKK